MSNSLKNATRIARYVFENNLIASASEEGTNNFGTSFSSDALSSKSANKMARSDISPTMIRDGCKLSYKAFPSRKNSGENIKFSVPNFFFESSV